jgi:hypothetical protein
MNSSVWFDDVSHFTAAPRPVTGQYDEYLPSLYRGNAPIDVGIPPPSPPAAIAVAVPRGLSKGAIAAICISVALVLVFVWFLFWYFNIGKRIWPKKHRKKRKEVPDDDDDPEFADDDDGGPPGEADAEPRMPEPEIALADLDSDSSFVLDT